MRLSLVLFSFFVFAPVQAKFFQNSYISFEIPETWKCKPFGTDWVCHSKLQGKKVEALITSTAKISGPNDTLDQYLSYLQEPKTWYNIKKEQITSTTVLPAKKSFINKYPWIDSIHKNSEIKSYISRYAGTVCCKNSPSQLGILLVLSAHQDHYTKYSSAFVKAINSLRVMDISKAIPKIRESQASSGSVEKMSTYLEGIFDDEAGNLGEVEEKSKTILFGLNSIQLTLFLLIFFAIVVYFIIKKRKRRSLRRRRKK